VEKENPRQVSGSLEAWRGMERAARQQSEDCSVKQPRVATASMAFAIKMLAIRWLTFCSEQSEERWQNGRRGE
jgi:hypothetical protein